jgi:16S rRNA (guanine527-N7)-methyltransferase
MSRDAVAALPGVSRETLARLDRLVDLVERWTPRINLISRSTVPEIWTRHILDSAQLWTVAPVPTGLWVDLGAGGGFPGLVLAAMAQGTATELALVESDKRKAAFLTTAAQAMGLRPRVHAARIEALSPLGATTVSARALAPFPQIVDLALPHCAPEGRLVLPVGARTAGPGPVGLDSRALSVETHPSRTDPESAILILTKTGLPPDQGA